MKTAKTKTTKKPNLHSGDLGLAPLQEKTQSLTITNQHTFDEAAELLVTAKKLYKASKEDMDALIDPLKESIANIKEKYAPTQEALKSVIDSLTSQMTQYQTNLINAQRERELAITERIGTGKGKLTLQTAVKKLENLPQVEKNHETSAGKMTFVEHQMFEVISIAELPIEYHIPNETLIRQAMKEGTQLPGVRYWTEQRPRNTR